MSAPAAYIGTAPQMHPGPHEWECIKCRGALDRPRTVLEMDWLRWPEWAVAVTIFSGIMVSVAGLVFIAQTWYPFIFFGERLWWLGIGESMLAAGGVVVGYAIGFGRRRSS